MTMIGLGRSASIWSAAVLFSATPTMSFASHSWGNPPYHWGRTSNPFVLKLGNNTTASWSDRLRQTSADWNSPTSTGAPSTPLTTSVVAGQTNSATCAAVRGTTQVCNGTYGRSGWLGIARIWLSGGHITQGTAKVNDTYFNSSTYNNINAKQHVMCQEVAHTFGLGHTSTNGSSQNTCMDYFSNTGRNATSTLSTKPNSHDFEQLTDIYSHNDGSSTVSPATGFLAAASNRSNGQNSRGEIERLAAAAAIVTDKPDSWGELEHQSPNRKISLYKRTFDGITILTHVHWTDEAAAVCSNPKCDHRYDRH